MFGHRHEKLLVERSCLAEACMWDVGCGMWDVMVDGCLSRTKYSESRLLPGRRAEPNDDHGRALHQNALCGRSGGSGEGGRGRTRHQKWDPTLGHVRNSHR